MAKTDTTDTTDTVNFVVPVGCGAAEVVETTINGYASSKICFLLEKLKEKSKNNNVELSFLSGGKYHVKCNGKGGIIDNIPQKITTMSLLLMMEYLNRSPIICNTCKICLHKGHCPKTFFV